MAHITDLTKAHNNLYSEQANTYSYSGSFTTFKGSEVIVKLDGVTLTYQNGTINESASPREYTVNLSDQTIHIGGADLGSGTISIYPVTDLGEPTPRASFAAGSAITASDLTNNQLQVMRKAMEFDTNKLDSTGGTLTGDLVLGQNANIQFEGSADDVHETTLTVTNPTADRTITFPNVTGTVVTTGDTGTVATGMLADNAITTVKITDSNVTTAKIAADAITNAKIADDSIDSEHYADGSIDTAHIAGAQVTDVKLASNSVTTSKITDANVTTAKLAADSVTIAKIGCEQTTISDSDSHIPTSGAVVDYVAAQIAPIGGLEVIADDESFPETQPANGVVISIADAGGLVVNGSGTSTTGDTITSNTEVTINNINSQFNSTTIAAGVGMLVTSTGSGQIYNYHKATLKEADLINLSTDINDFGNRYRVNAGEPGSNNDEGDLVYDTNADKIKVYDSSTSAWKELTTTGEFKYLFLCPAGGSGAPTLDGSIATYDLRESSNSGSTASVTTAAQLIVSLNGVIQKANTGTSAPSEGFALVDANTIIFGANLASGDTVFIIQIGSAVSVPTPGDNSVTTAKIASGAVTTAKIADANVTTAKIADEAVTLAKLPHGDGTSDGKFLRSNNGADPTFETISSVGGATGIDFNDDVKLRFGTGLDSDISYNGVNLVIDTNAGDITLDAADDINLLAADDIYLKTGGEDAIKCIGNGAVSLYHNDALKLQTTSTGVDIFGSLQNVGVGTAVCVLRQVESHNADGGTFTSGEDRVRILKSKQHDGESFCTLDTGTGEFTLPAGTYLMYFSAMAFDVNVHRTKIVTDGGTDKLFGDQAFSNMSSPNQNNSSGFGVVTNASTEGYFLKHRCSVTKSSIGMGRPCNFTNDSGTDEEEFYAQVIIWRMD